MYVVPHKKISRKVLPEDKDTVFAEAERMTAAFMNHRCVALAHPQVEDKDPLAFFLTREGYLFVNPEIIRHSGYTVDSVEGCMTFIDKPVITKQRWHKIELRSQTIMPDGTLSDFIVVALSGKQSFMVQHEVDHLHGVYCYDT